MDIGEKGIQRAVPKGFPYMLVEWETKAGERGALVHVTEAETKKGMWSWLLG